MKGLYRNLPMSRYLGHPSLARSGLIQFQERLGERKKRKKKDTDAKTLGTLCHTASLEPELLDRVVAMPETKPKTGKKFIKRGKDWDEFKAENKGKEIITAHQYETMHRVYDSVFNDPDHREAAEFLTGGDNEVSGFYEYELETGQIVKLKCRPDVLKPGVVVNLKTTADATKAFQQRHFYDLCYHWSLFFELEGLTAITGKRHNTYKFVCVETTDPYEVAVYELAHEYRKIARREILPALETYVEMKERGEAPCYPRGTQILYPPKHARIK